MHDPDAESRALRRTNSTPALTSIVEGRCAVVLPSCWPDALTETRRMRYETFAQGMTMHVSDAKAAARAPTPVELKDDAPAQEAEAAPVVKGSTSSPPLAAATPTSEHAPVQERADLASNSATHEAESAPTPATDEATTAQENQCTSASPAEVEKPTATATGAEPAAAADAHTTPASASAPHESSSSAASRDPRTPTPPAESPVEEVEATTIEPYDADQMPNWLSDYRESVHHCPRGVRAFAETMKLSLDNRAPAGASSVPGRGGLIGGAHQAKGGPHLGGKFADAHAHPHGTSGNMHNNYGGMGGGAGAGGGPGLSSSWGTSGNGSGKSGLEAIEQLWEDRKDIPISMGGSLRRRGLFGDAEKKEIHHMVTAVLNKVTTDPAKFREVKNELLRLPIPEANAAQLDSVVDVFVHKAISEPDFSHSYADLLEALCKIPQGQEVTGDRSQTLEYRLRRAIVTRCQHKFLEGTAKQAAEHARLIARIAKQQGVTPEALTDFPRSEYDLALIADQEGEDAEEADVATRELRDTMCGIVRFVSELFLRHMIASNVLAVILFVCLTGAGDGHLDTPPVYLPTESQLDEVMTLFHTAGKAYFVDVSKGRAMLHTVLRNLEYWGQHYPVSRTRFLLITEVDTLRQWGRLIEAAKNTSSSGSFAPPAGGASGAAPMPTPPPHLGSNSPSTRASPPPAPPVTATAAPPALALRNTSPTVAPPVEVPASTPAIASTTSSPRSGIPAPRSRLASAAAAAVTSGSASPMPNSPPPVSFDDANNRGAAAAAAATSAGNSEPAPVATAPVPPVPRSVAQTAAAAAAAAPSPSAPVVAPAPQAPSQPPAPPQPPTQPQPAAPAPQVPLPPAGPVETVRPPLKHAVNAAEVAELMSRLTKAGKDDTAGIDLAAREVAQAMEESYGDVLPCVSRWLDRCVTVAKEDRARQRTSLVLRYVMQAGPAPPSRDELRDVAVLALQRAVLANIHDELHIFRFWAQMVLADGARGVLDEEMLNEGLAMVLACAPDAAEDYLADVGKLHAMALQSEAYKPPTFVSHANLYPRYRPLLWVYNAQDTQGSDAVLALVNQPALRQQSMEVAIFCAVVTGQPSLDSVFGMLRESPRLVRADPTLAAEVMSALMLSEICSAFRPFIENNIVLVQTVVDGIDRRERERAILAEVHHITQYAGCLLPAGCDLRLANRLVNLRVVSNESVEEAATAWELEHQAAEAAAVAALAGASADAQQQAALQLTSDETSRNANDSDLPRTPIPAPPPPSNTTPQSTPTHGAPGPSQRGRGGGRGGGGSGGNVRGSGSRGGGGFNMGGSLSATGSFARSNSADGSSDTNSNAQGRGRRGSTVHGTPRGSNGGATATGAKGAGLFVGSPNQREMTGQVSHGSFAGDSNGTGSRFGGSPLAATGSSAGSPAGGARWGSFTTPKSNRSGSDSFDAVAASYRAKYLARGSGGGGSGSRGGGAGAGAGAGAGGSGERKRGGRGGRGRK